jgi:putative transferase (TIGR04331 family)
MFLATTADHRFWKKDEKILFLGEWCRLSDQKEIWSELDYEILPYHWNDRQRLYSDFKYLKEVYEKYLQVLADKLNNIHSCHYSLRYWRILIGPWLALFTGLLYDRYLSLKEAKKTEKITSVWIQDLNSWSMVPREYSFPIDYYTLDSWNQFIYGEIIRELNLFPYQKADPPDLPRNLDDGNQWKPNSKKLMTRLIARFFGKVFGRSNKLALIETGFSTWDLVRLQISLGQFPCPFSPKMKVPDVSADVNLRQEMIIPHASNPFEKIMEKIIPLQMPTAYLEGYQMLREQALKLFPKQPSLIYTSYAFSANEGFKVWAAENVDNGARLLLSQHGGHYGTGLWEQSEDHQIAISDRFYSWGWNNRSETNIKPMPSGKLQTAKKIKSNPESPILYVLLDVPRYSYRMFSVPVGPQFLDYMSDQMAFLNTISPDVRELLRVRPKTTSYGWSIESRFKDTGFGGQLDSLEKSFLERLRDSRLLISTCNQTTYLETFAANFPTLLFWNPLYWELRPQAEPFFDELRQIGILHDTPESAASKLNDIYDNPMEWWLEPERQLVVKKFNEEFALTSDDWLMKWKNEFRDVAEGTL